MFELINSYNKKDIIILLFFLSLPFLILKFSKKNRYLSFFISFFIGLFLLVYNKYFTKEIECFRPSEFLCGGISAHIYSYYFGLFFILFSIFIIIKNSLKKILRYNPKNK
ncbi:MAG: hypothetical protein COX80_00695 [Candidatus Magasanikbacteria bacterium CG_4_10_14_0_2_um_filter_33_14]|uniref:Uncharacterized protein n=1 Tax=Candidatus Magasanikbacteria bacterium CG_4_10_14_0_2_um_filter_33_14 TaxID=1974636 RepID=A0A2M7VBW1_9BACT|nr:MAG: hypothetical protein COX80_00695 [Candidatus Magasanikbacteria bacterium CG_4_10_14_0_2_um_filter_33_14]